MNKKYKKLIEEAKRVSQNAYAPYSKFKVGSALLTSKGNIYTGCNVENISYGITNCAERVAIGKAVSEGEKKFVAIALTTHHGEMATPCGACRQVIHEFGKDIIIVMASSKGKVLIKKISDLLPLGFSSPTLK